MRGARDAQHAQAVGGHRVDGSRQRRARRRRRAGTDRRSLPARPWRRRGSRADRRPPARRASSPADRAAARRRAPASSADAGTRASVSCCARQVWNAFSIGSNGSGALASRPNSPSVVELRRHCRAVLRAEDVAVRQPQLGDRHAVLGQRAGLVGAQHGGRAQRLDRGGAPRQHARPRDAPRAHRHEDGQHDRKLLRQHRHAERNAGQHARRASRRARCRRAAPRAR